MAEPAAYPSKRLALAAFWLGFALSSFFDGILLHQILQWHHLLSGLENRGAPFADLRFQVLADGYFHLLAYVIATAGLWLLWRARHAFAHPSASNVLISWLLIGFAAWHFVDAVGSHWITGIHRIRMDAENPLAWDLGWLIAFGVAPLVLGLLLRSQSRRSPPTDRPTRGGGAATLAILAVVVLGSAICSSQRPPGQTFTTIVFAPSVSFDDGIRAAHAAGEGLFWFNDDGVFVVAGRAEQNALTLYSQGALLVSGAGMPPGCFAWTKT